MAVFLLIGKTSALTMNIAGVVKDWLLIGLSVMLYKCVPAPVRSASAAHACTANTLVKSIDSWR